jgi:hypothetical protein
VWISIVEASGQVFPQIIDDIESDGGPAVAPANSLDGGLSDAISAIVASPSDFPPDDGAQKGAGPSARKRLATFFGETWPQPTRSVTYDVFKRLMQGKRPRWQIIVDFEKDYREPWTCIGTLPEAGPLDARIGTVLMQRYAWADALAVGASQRYRSAYMLCHFLAAIAMGVALLGIFHPPAWMPVGELYYKGALVLLECALIGRIASIVLRGRSARWQEKWVEYRALAEMLRGVRFLAYLGEHGHTQRPDREPASSAWFVWYLRATLREIGLPHAVLDGRYQHILLQTVEVHVIDDQLAYHRDNTSTLSRMHRVVHGAANASFIVTSVLLVVYLLTFSVAAVGVVSTGQSLAELGGSTDSTPNKVVVGDKSTNPPAQPAGTAESAPNAPPAASKKADPLADKQIGPHETGFMRLGHHLISMKDILTFSVAFLTALGAAFAGIREAAEFESSAEHSAKAAVALQNLKGDIAQARHELTLDMTSEALLKTAQVLTEDLAAWQSVYGRKQLNLT